MTEWLYKAKEVPSGDAPRPDYETTRAFAVNDGILCRSARNKKGYWIDNVQWVKAGHVIHLYFKQHSKAAYDLIGSFHVSDPGAARVEEGCDLAFVSDAELEQRLRAAYRMKPEERVMGWLLTPAQDVQAPSFEEEDVEKFLHEQPTLVKYRRPAPVSETFPKDRILTAVSAQLPTLAAPLHFIHGPLLVTVETWSDGTVVARFPAGRLYGEGHDDATAMEALSERITEFVETHLFHAHAGKLAGTLAKQWAALTAMIDVSAVRVSMDGAREVG
jgi:hypothetical protein